MTTRQLALDLGHRVAMEREDFLVSACNSDAVAWIDRWPDWPGPALVLHGPPASGRTHLLHVWQARASAVIVPAAALASGLPDARAVAVDDAEGLAGDRAGEEALLHLYNMQKEKGGHLVVVLPEAAARAGLSLPDLKSRLLAAPSAGISLPDDEFLSALFVKLFADRQVRLSEEVLAYILPRAERSFAAAQALVGELDARAIAEKRPVTVALARAVLKK